MSQFPDIKLLVRKCLAFPTFKVREMAVKSILPLSSANELVEETLNFFNSPNQDLNLVHGYLLLLSEVLKKSDLESIHSIQQSCEKWKWLNMSKCDVIQALYFKLCHEIYFVSAANDGRYAEARKNIWNLSKKGLNRLTSSGMLSYGALTSNAEIYLWGKNEFSSQADIDIVTLISHPLYEVQIATFRFLCSSQIGESQDLKSILDACLLILYSKDTKEEVLRCVGEFLGRHCKYFSGTLSSHSDFLSLCEANILADRLIDVYLPSMGSIIAMVRSLH